MKKLLIFCLAIGFVFAISGMAQANMITVDDSGGADYTTIQPAIDAANHGDIIIVAAGTYDGFNVNKTLTLRGANVNIDPAGPVSRVDESVITGAVKITADVVTVNGFKMTSNSYIEISDASNTALNVIVSYNILENTTWADGAVDLNGGNRCAGGYIGYNTISGASGYGIQTIQNNDVTIEYNHVLNSSGFAALDAGYHDGTGIVIHGNTITNSGGKGINYWAEDDGVITGNVISNSNFEAIYTDALATISGNQISGGDMYGILVVAWTGGTAAGSTVSGNTISDTKWEGIQSDVPVIITNNDISGGCTGIQLSEAASGSVIDGNNIHDNDGFGLSILDSVIDVMVQNNQLANNPWCGVIVWGDDAGYEIHINCNEITGNGYGVWSGRTNSYVDATQNWWGDTSGPSGEGPGTGDAVSTNVDYDPWSFTPDPCEAKTLGFWKNHADSVNAVLDDYGPIILGDQTKNEFYFVVDDYDDAKDVFDNAKNKNANTMLAAQLLAAKLNVLHLAHLGIVYCGCIDGVIDDADGILITNEYGGPGTPGTAPRGEAKDNVNEIKDDLDEYNQGVCPC